MTVVAGVVWLIQSNITRLLDLVMVLVMVVPILILLVVL